MKFKIQTVGDGVGHSLSWTNAVPEQEADRSWQALPQYSQSLVGCNVLSTLNEKTLLSTFINSINIIHTIDDII